MNQSTIERLSSVSYKINVKVPAAILQTRVDDKLKHMQKSANLKGFRPGKAPIQLIRETYGQRAVVEAVEDVVNRSFSEAAREHKVNPYSYPEFEFDPPVLGQDFSFTAQFEVLPEITKVDYANIVVEKEKVKITDEDVNRVIQSFMRRLATYEPVTEERVAQKQDFVDIDFDGTVDGTPINGGSAKGYRIQLGSNQMIAGFEEGIEGMKVGEEKMIVATFPNPYPEASLAGKKADFKIKLNSITKEVIPPLSEEFLKALGAESEEAYKAKVKGDLEHREADRIQAEMSDKVVEKLIEKNPLEVPASMVESQKKHILEDYERRLKSEIGEAEFSRMKEEQEKEWDSEAQKTAERIVKGSLLVQALSRIEKLDPTDAEFEEYLAGFAKSSNTTLEKVKAELKTEKGRDIADRWWYRHTQSKVIDKVISVGTVVEVESKRP